MRFANSERLALYCAARYNAGSDNTRATTMTAKQSRQQKIAESEPFDEDEIVEEIVKTELQEPTLFDDMLAQYETDPTLTREGVKLEFMVGDKVATFYVRPQHEGLNKEWRRALLEMAKKFDRFRRDSGLTTDEEVDKNIPEELDRQIMIDAYFGAIVTGWDLGVPFTAENFRALMMRCPVVFEAIERK